MDRIELKIYYTENNVAIQRCTVNKWKFQDTMMGEQFITFNVMSDKPIDWSIGDWCEFRGETYTLNYIPSVKQRARTGAVGDAYTYDNVKFESRHEELTRCIMLDITPTNGSYVAALGTNYTGSSKFQLFCGETVVGEPQQTLTAVCALAAKMQANLDRMFPTNGWEILVDTTTTVTKATGETVVVTHTDDKVLSFDNTTVAKALEEVHNTFDLDYCIRGRKIYIGYNMANLTGNDHIIADPTNQSNETFSFGYGKGWPTHDDMNKGLFEIKRIANSQQKIVTRLRALGSTKNMPYRYYNKKYASDSSDLAQTLFPTNLQLPDTFASAATKSANNDLRDPNLRAVKGDTNDAYIDKNDDAEHCAEGIREDCARWDGTNSELQEIYPTIEEATYGELRNAGVEDQDGITGLHSFDGYADNERIDKLLAIGYKDGNALVDDANTGDGILSESGFSASGILRSADIGLTDLTFNTSNEGNFIPVGNNAYSGPEKTLFTIRGVSKGKYAMTPTAGAVFYGFRISCNMAGLSADVGYIITIKQENLQTGETSTIATYKSDYQYITDDVEWAEVELPEIPDVKNGANAKVSEVKVTALSDITVTFKPVLHNVGVPNGFTGDISLSYQVGKSTLEHTVAYDPEYRWISLDNTDSVSETFHVFIQDMGFDLQACWTDDKPVVAMKSGRCVGREFEIGENIEKVTHNGKKGYMLTLNRATDNTLNTYYPSATDPIAAGDYFVLLNISMPDVYVKAAELRLLSAATQYLADNCETRFTYQPSIDDIYLQRDLDKCRAEGREQESIWWRLYAGLKFTFLARFESSDEDKADELLTAEITIEQVTISMGDGLTPKVELKLNDDVQQSTIQKLTTSVDRIYNGSIFSSGSGGSGGGGAMSAALLSILQSEGEKLFLSKKHDDVADGKVTFNDVVTHNERLKAKRGLRVGNFQSRLLGSGAYIDEEGNAEFESIYSRNFISTPEFRFNRVNVTEGEQWCTNGYGTIKEVEVIDETTGYITLKLEENEYASIAEGDICRGIYNDIRHEYVTANLDDDSELYDDPNAVGADADNSFGFSCKKGFFTSYFWIQDIGSNDRTCYNRKGECRFKYELRNTRTPHPCEFMNFAQYGSFTERNRMSSCYATSIGHYYEMVLEQVSNWKISSANVVFRKGWLGDMTIEDKTRGEIQLQGYGLYAQDNVYFGSAVVQLDPKTLADIADELKNYDVSFSSYVDVITVDDVGNCIGGLWSASGNNNEYRNYRIHSAITVKKNGNLLIQAADSDDAGEGTYKINALPVGCTCVIKNSTIYITSINNIKDGVAGSQDDANFDFDAMRNMDSCRVDLIINCEGKGIIQKTFSITIKHDSQPYVGADINHEFSSVSWSTKTQRYIGLPITFDMKMWHNNVPLDIASANDISVTPSIQGMTFSKSIDTQNGAKVARIIITALPAELQPVTELNITCVATYAGVRYERTLIHTINRMMDVNVYSLSPDPTSVLFNSNTNVLSFNEVSCSVVCDSSDGNHYIVPYNTFNAHGIILKYRKYYTDGTQDNTETTYINNAVGITSSVSCITFSLYGSSGSGAPLVTYDVYVVPSGKDLRENLINNSLVSHTTQMPENNVDYYYDTDKTYTAENMPDAGTKVSAQARVTLENCLFTPESRVIFFIQCVLNDNAVSWLHLIDFVPTENGTFDMKYDGRTIPAKNGGQWSGVVHARINNITGGTVSIGRMKLEVGNECSAWCLSEKDKIGQHSYMETQEMWNNDADTHPSESDSGWSSTTPTKNGTYLWRRSRTMTLNATILKYVASVWTYQRLSGTNGTSINTRGSVSDSSKRGNGTATITDGTGSATLITMNNGDAVVQSDNGHLYQWVVEGSTGQWLDIGQFKGDAGVTYYTHIVWATAINGTFESTLPIPTDNYGQKTKPNVRSIENIVGFTIGAGTNMEGYAWQGILINQNEEDPPYSKANYYTWNRVMGASPWQADLTNEMDSIACDSSWHPTEVQSVSTVVGLWHGSTSENFTLSVYRESVSNANELTSGISKDGVTATFSAGSGGSRSVSLSFAPTATINNRVNFILRLTGSGETRDLTFTVNAIAGTSVYNLHPSETSIHVGRLSDGSYSPSTFTLRCGFTKKERGVVSVTAEASKENMAVDGLYSIFYRKHHRTNGWQDSYYHYSYYDSTIQAMGLTAVRADLYDEVEFIMTKYTNGQTPNASDMPASSIIDRETLPVVSDGEVGESAPALIAVPSVICVPTDNQENTTGTFNESISLRMEVSGNAATITSLTVVHRPKYESQTQDVSTSKNVPAGTALISIQSGTSSQDFLGTLEIVANGTYNGKTYSASVGVPITAIRTGASGSKGKMYYPAGAYPSSGGLFTSTSDLCPVVEYGGQYYYLKSSTNVVNGSYVAPGNTSVWGMMSQFASVFTEALFTSFAKLGSFVVSGDFFISQYGTLVGPNGVRAIDGGNYTTLYGLTSGNEITNVSGNIVYPVAGGRVAYTYFDESDPMASSTPLSGMKFRPSKCINALTGEEWIAEGAVHLNKSGSSFSGTVYAESGVFSGFVKKKKTVITAQNITDYGEYVQDPYYENNGGYDIDLEKAGTWLDFSSFEGGVGIIIPDIRPGVNYSTSAKERARSLIGNVVLIYNHNEQERGNIQISANCKTSESQGSTSFGLQPGEFAMMECRVKVTNGQEEIYWLYVKGESR